MCPSVQLVDILILKFAFYTYIKMTYLNTVANVFIGCCLSAFFMEILMAVAPDSANLITFLQFFVVTLQGIVFSKIRILSPKIPLQKYFLLIALFFITSVANNYVYALHVPSTLHMIVRSASSPASMLVSWYAKNQRPRNNAIIGSIIISIGVSLAMFGDAAIVEDRKGKFLHWCIGVIILITMLFVGAFTGLQQEFMFKKYGKHPKEMLFYTHSLSLPLFLGMYPGLQDKAMSLSCHCWCFIALNIVSQIYCTHAVHDLATKETSMTVTFILTLRKFVSLMISSIIFKNRLTLLHVIGTVLVIVGTYFYFDFFKSRKQQPISRKEGLVHQKKNI